MSSHRKTPRATEDWSNPPPGIISSIEKRLESRIDVLRCRSVCKNWRASINPNPNPSILYPILPRKISNSSSLPFNNRSNEPLILFNRSVLLIKPPSNDDDSYSSSWILTVEEVNQGKLRILFPLSNDLVTNLPSNFPDSLNLLDYNVTEIAKSFGFKYASDGKDVEGVHKVILCSDFTAMVIYGEGFLVGVKLRKGKWGFVRESLVTPFYDVIEFKGMVSGVDYNSNLHIVDHTTLKVIKSIVFDPELGNSIRSKKAGKRLVEHKGKLFLIDWCNSSNSSFETVEVGCHNLDEKRNKWISTRLQGLVLFVSRDGCFLVCPQALGISDYFPKKLGEYSTKSSSWNVAKSEYIVLSLSCFSSSTLPTRLKVNYQSFEGAHVNLSTGLFYYTHEEIDRCAYIRKIIAEALWPPPIWFWPDEYTFSGDDEDDEDLEFWVQDVTTDNKRVLPPPLTVPALIRTAKSNGQVPRTKEIDVHTALEDSHPLRIQNVNSCASTSLFERVKIKSNLLPTLQNIWAKHGNILEECKVRSGDLIAKALESLATIVLILQSSSGRSLNDIQAEYLRCTLSDLQLMDCKVDWLVPFIEKALAVHKSKPLVDSMKEFDEAKARAKEMKLKLLDEIAKLDDVEEDMNFVFEKIPSLESVDLNESLGKGIC